MNLNRHDDFVLFTILQKVYDGQKLDDNDWFEIKRVREKCLHTTVTKENMTIYTDVVGKLELLKKLGWGW